MDRIRRDRLKWKCRRGLLELDLVLGRFVAQQAPALGAAELAALEELLDYPDNDLWDVITGRSERVDPRLRGIVSQLRAI
ncbi:MAG TPA: succinate dehydrogenase assembly factor 2 [Burkholderiales bacterium]|nr:succinate dehydrogenase assembly factor 2 [Burkholderiales bacterium]